MHVEIFGIDPIYLPLACTIYLFDMYTIYLHEREKKRESDMYVEIFGINLIYLTLAYTRDRAERRVDKLSCISLTLLYLNIVTILIL